MKTSALSNHLHGLFLAQGGIPSAPAMKFPKLPSLANLETISASEIQKRKARASAVGSAITDEFIRQGRGYERPSDIDGKTDPLSLADIEARRVVREIQSELRARNTYHGSDRPIRKPQF